MQRRTVNIYNAEVGSGTHAGGLEEEQRGDLWVNLDDAREEDAEN